MTARRITAPPPPPSRAAPAPVRSAVLAVGTLMPAAAGSAPQVVVTDPAQASRLHAKGSVGTPGPDGALRLSLVEAAFSVAEGRLALAASRAGGGDKGPAPALADLLALGSRNGHETETSYLVYRDLRERGLVVRPADGEAGRFAVWPRGTAQGEPAFHALACSDADGLDVATLEAAAAAHSVLSVADADGTVTHYQATVDQPAGDLPAGDLPRAKGAVLADRVLVTDPAAVQAFSQREALGTRHGAELFLSFVEAEALRRRGVLAVPAGLAGRGEAARLLPVHLALRAAGAVPKSGFKFGTHLRAYRGAPDDSHAEWLVHCALPDEVLAWSVLSRGVRLAHGVRKRFLVAVTPTGTDGKPTFTHLAWFRP